jgi:hypothetical protein
VISEIRAVLDPRAMLPVLGQLGSDVGDNRAKIARYIAPTVTVAERFIILDI